jgi:hypothetical protein
MSRSDLPRAEPGRPRRLAPARVGLAAVDGPSPSAPCGLGSIRAAGSTRRGRLDGFGRRCRITTGQCRSSQVNAGQGRPGRAGPGWFDLCLQGPLGRRGASRNWIGRGCSSRGGGSRVGAVGLGPGRLWQPRLAVQRCSCRAGHLSPSRRRRLGPTRANRGPSLGPTWVQPGPTWVQLGPMQVQPGPTGPARGAAGPTRAGRSNRGPPWGQPGSL